jgi:transposase-like protein
MALGRGEIFCVHVFLARQNGPKMNCHRPLISKSKTVNKQTKKPDSEEDTNLACPSCGSQNLYTLSDERKMCRDCRKKFTPCPKSFRLPENQKEEIAEYFWEMIPAEEGAKNLALNRKTLQRYYRHLRREIARVSDEQLATQALPSNDDSSAQTVFRDCYIAIMEKQLIVLSQQAFSALQPLTTCAKVIYKNGSSDRFKLDNLTIRKFDTGDIIEAHDRKYETIHKFWFYAIPQLAQYKVVNNNNFYYFLKEMEFRFNTAQKEAAINFLINSLSSISEHQ